MVTPVDTIEEMFEVPVMLDPVAVNAPVVNAPEQVSWVVAIENRLVVDAAFRVCVVTLPVDVTVGVTTDVRATSVAVFRVVAFAVPMTIEGVLRLTAFAVARLAEPLTSVTAFRVPVTFAAFETRNVFASLSGVFTVRVVVIRLLVMMFEGVKAP